MATELVCWKCGASLDGLPLPLARLAECEACHVDVHVCRQCEFHDPRVSRGCREPVAEDVKDKERANFCGYFRPRPRAYQARDDADARKSKAALDALFGTDQAAAPDLSQPDAAREELERLFGLDDKESGR